MNLLAYEQKLNKDGYKVVVGTDEAGRGPLYGPVVAACCYLPPHYDITGINDSKKLSPKKREIMYQQLIKDTIYGVGIVSAKEIDEINIYEASRKAMIIAINQVAKQIKIDYVLSDAMPIKLEVPVMPIIKGDAKSASIGAASIIAKVTRDHLMIELSRQYPEYGFDKHKGYPTKAHLKAINEYGLIPGYRETYGPVKAILEKEKK